MFSFVPALFAAVAAQPVPSPPTPTIVVTAPSRDYRRALEACIARRCPTDEDVDATAALAESLFLEGEYQQARRAVRESLRRNRNAAARYPEPVSDLHRINARLSRHLGLDQHATASTWSILRALQAGLPTEDHRHFTARLEIVQALAAFGRYREAMRELDELGARARAVGRDDIAEMAVTRSLWLGYLEDQNGPGARRLAAVAEGREQASPIVTAGARMLMIRVYSERGDTARADALVATLGRASRRRQLLFSPPYELVQREDTTGANARDRDFASIGGAAPMLTSNLQDRLVDNFDDEWMEIGFWITGEGGVEDLAIIRRGRPGGGWEAPLLESIRGRRYTASADGTRTYRLERYTYTSDLREAGATTGTRLAQRSPRARVEYFDLSSGAGNRAD